MAAKILVDFVLCALLGAEATRGCMKHIMHDIILWISIWIVGIICWHRGKHIIGLGFARKRRENKRIGVLVSPMLLFHGWLCIWRKSENTFFCLCVFMQKTKYIWHLIFDILDTRTQNEFPEAISHEKSPLNILIPRGHERLPLIIQWSSFKAWMRVSIFLQPKPSYLLFVSFFATQYLSS